MLKSFLIGLLGLLVSYLLTFGIVLILNDFSYNVQDHIVISLCFLSAVIVACTSFVVRKHNSGRKKDHC